MPNFVTRFFARNRDAPSVPTGRVSGTSSSQTIISPYKSRATEILKELRLIRDERAAIAYLAKHHPDMSFALWNYLRLANQGHTMEFYGVSSRNKGKRQTDIEAEWTTFVSRINAISNDGLDGLINILHKNAILFGAQMCEAAVLPDLSDIEDVYPIDPRTVEWKLEDREGKKVWVPYQYINGQKVDLSLGNIFNVPFDPDTNRPDGNLMFAAAVLSIDFQLQAYTDMSAVLRRQGYPRNDVEIDREALLKSAPPAVRSDPVMQKKFLEEYFAWMNKLLSELEPTQDYLHYNDTKINMAGSGTASRSMDIRAYNEMTDTQTMGGLKTLGIMLNRHTGRTETYGTIELKIMVEGIKSLQRGSKRLIESIAKLWLRVHGYQAVPKFTHNPVDWQSEIDKWTVGIMKQQFYANAQVLEWISADEAAQGAMGKAKSFGQANPESIPIKFDVPGGETLGNDKHSRDKPTAEEA
jgi:hypothetical protein